MHQRTSGVVDGHDRATVLRLGGPVGVVPGEGVYGGAPRWAAGDVQLDAARTLLLIPDLFGFWLTGRKAAEYTKPALGALAEQAAPLRSLVAGRMARHATAMVDLRELFRPPQRAVAV